MILQVFLGVLGAPVFAQTPREKVESVLPAPMSAAAPETPEASLAPGLCRVKEFSSSLEGWRRDKDPRSTRPCAVEPIGPQATCLKEPCFHVACLGVIHFHAVVELSPGAGRLWPSCYFKQQRMGTRSHNEEGARKNDQQEAAPAIDSEGSVELRAVKFTKVPVPDQPNTFEVDFYDMPGWGETYWNGRPNATPPQYFPLDWHYMYRSYLGPKREGLSDADYRYSRIDMEAGATPEPGFKLLQASLAAQDWAAFQRELCRLPPLPQP